MMLDDAKHFRFRFSFNRIHIPYMCITNITQSKDIFHYICVYFRCLKEGVVHDLCIILRDMAWFFFRIQIHTWFSKSR